MTLIHRRTLRAGVAPLMAALALSLGLALALALVLLAVTWGASLRHLARERR